MNDTPPGWYPDHADQSQVRYWNGSEWTVHVKPVDVNPSANPSQVARVGRDEKAQMKELARAAKAAERQREAYLATPVGRAEMAAQRGDRFFQVEIPHSTLSGYSNDWGHTDKSKTTRHGGAPDLLGQIEELGWRLEHVTWLFIETGSSSREKMLTSGQRATVTGRVDGIYLFRRVTSAP